jgi:aminoglycoside phosphotransferase family enzyme
MTHYSGTAAPDTAARVTHLASGREFRLSDRPVTVVETHTSWLFLGESTVLKLKKPVRFPFLDLTTPERRRHNCESELRLNRRLAPGVYRRILPLRVDAAGRLATRGDGLIIDWLVEMRRLPADRMLDTRIRTAELTRTDVEAIAHRLVPFYAKARRQRRDGPRYLRHLLVESGINRQILMAPALGLDTAEAGRVLDQVDALLERCRPEIEARIADGYIVEGHGDLRPAHVCVLQPPLVFDCLEFDRSMRLIDPYDEINFLGMECAMLGAAWVRPLLLSIFRRHLGHPPSRALLAAYGAFRAALRARLCLAHLLDEHPERPQSWVQKAERYLSFAAREAAKASPLPSKSELVG